MSPGVLGLLLQMLQGTQVTQNTNLRIGNPFYMFHPEKHKVRLQSFIQAADICLLPVYSGKAAAWAVCEIVKTTSTTRECTIHHWHKHKHEALSLLEHDLNAILHVDKCQRRVYQFKLPQTHMIVINVVVQNLLGRKQLVSGGVNIPCDAPFAVTHKKMRHFLEESITVACREDESDLRKVARKDENIKAIVEPLLDWTALLLENSAPIASEQTSATAVKNVDRPTVSSSKTLPEGPQPSHSETVSDVPASKNVSTTKPGAMRACELPRAKPLF